MSEKREMSVFPGLIKCENDVSVGDYRIVNGNESPISFSYFNLHFYTKAEAVEGPFDGVECHGEYVDTDPTGAEISLPVVSFLYHKKCADGQIENKRRMIILTGVGFGVHGQHIGQGPSEYLIGPQIGTLDNGTGALSTLQTKPDTLTPKHFSIACIQGNPYGEVIPAN
jgi:hypothetical protein